MPSCQRKKTLDIKALEWYFGHSDMRWLHEETHNNGRHDSSVMTIACNTGLLKSLVHGKIKLKSCNCKASFSTCNYWLRLVHLTSGECHWTSLMMNEHYLRCRHDTGQYNKMAGSLQTISINAFSLRILYFYSNFTVCCPTDRIDYMLRFRKLLD